MKQIIFYIFVFILGNLSLNAQQLNIKIIDSDTKSSIPNALIRIGNTNLISNDEGYFTISEENTKEHDFINISCIGYNTLKISIKDLISNNNIAEIGRKIHEIESVNISQKKVSPIEIMNLVNENIEINYNYSNYMSNIFTRRTETLIPKNIDINITNAKSLSKSERKDVNNQVVDITTKLKRINKKFKDILMNIYEYSDNDEQKNKIEIIKATILEDENNYSSINDAINLLGSKFLKVLDTTKFYRLKSGMFGSRDTISIKDNLGKKTVNYTDHLKGNTLNALKRNSFSSKHNISFNKTFNFIQNTNIYNYILRDVTYLDDDLVYVIDFNPKKGKAKYTGTLYVNKSDYAVIRVDYKLSEGKKLNNLNLKLILGLKISDNLHEGIIVYKKSSYDDFYHLHYAKENSGMYIYVSRPFKFIEINKGKKDKMSLNFKLEADLIDKYEFLNIHTEKISESDFNAVNEEETFKYEELKKYDPTIWENYNSIEPLEEMKYFEIIKD